MSVIRISPQLTADLNPEDESISIIEVKDASAAQLEAAQKGSPKVHINDWRLYLEKFGNLPGDEKPQDKELLHVAVITIREDKANATSLRTYAGFAQQKKVGDESYVLLYCPPGKIDTGSGGEPKPANPVVEEWEDLRNLLKNEGGQNVVK